MNTSVMSVYAMNTYVMSVYAMNTYVMSVYIDHVSGYDSTGFVTTENDTS